jgi:hypothetical protein
LEVLDEQRAVEDTDESTQQEAQGDAIEPGTAGHLGHVASGLIKEPALETASEVREPGPGLGRMAEAVAEEPAVPLEVETGAAAPDSPGDPPEADAGNPSPTGESKATDIPMNAVDNTAAGNEENDMSGESLPEDAASSPESSNYPDKRDVTDTAESAYGGSYVFWAQVPSEPPTTFYTEDGTPIRRHPMAHFEMTDREQSRTHVEVVVDAPNKVSPSKLFAWTWGFDDHALQKQLTASSAGDVPHDDRPQPPQEDSAFGKFDSNGDGFISAKDIDRVMRSQGLPSDKAQRRFAMLAEDRESGNGNRLSVNEYAATLERAAREQPRPEQVQLKVCTNKDRSKINILMVHPDPKAPNPVIEVHLDKPSAETDDDTLVFLDAVARQILPKNITETLTLADYAIDVVKADSLSGFLDATVGVVLRVIVSGIYHAHGLGVLLPLIGWLTDLLDQPPDKRSSHD